MSKDPYKLYQLYKGRIIGPKSTHWDTNAPKIYAYNQTQAAALLGKKNVIKVQEQGKLKLTLWERIKSWVTISR